MAETAGPDIAARVNWVEADLASWTPEPGGYDLVVCLYVHVAGSVPEMVSRMGPGVALGGTLFLVGHRPVDPATGAGTPAAGQQQVSVDAARAALDPDRWEFLVTGGVRRCLGRARRDVGLVCHIPAHHDAKGGRPCRSPAASRSRDRLTRCSPT